MQKVSSRSWVAKALLDANEFCKELNKFKDLIEVEDDKSILSDRSNKCEENEKNNESE